MTAPSNIHESHPLVSSKKMSEETMPENNQDPLDVPMEKVMTRTEGSSNENSVPKPGSEQATITHTPKIEGSHRREPVGPAEVLPEVPEEQNDLA